MPSQSGRFCPFSTSGVRASNGCSSSCALYSDGRCGILNIGDVSNQLKEIKGMLSIVVDKTEKYFR